MDDREDFDAFLNRAWDDHADDAAAVAARLQASAAALVAGDEQIAPLAHLAHHVFGAHLGRWQDGIGFLRRLAALPACGAQGGAALARFGAGLALAGGTDDPRAGLAPSEQVRVGALAAASLAAFDGVRAAALLRQALAAFEAAALPAGDPAARALAIAGNGAASTLEDKPARTAAERELMILAAQTSRRFWAMAGTWLETERAEYRLAKTWVQAGDALQARHHAQQCLDIVHEHDAPALERFFAWEALGVAARASGDAALHGQALARAREAFAALEEGDRGWCRASLDGLARG